MICKTRCLRALLARAPRAFAALGSRGIFEVWCCFLWRLPKLWQLMRCCCHTGAGTHRETIEAEQQPAGEPNRAFSLQLPKGTVGFSKNKRAFCPWEMSEPMWARSELFWGKTLRFWVVQLEVDCAAAALVWLFPCLVPRAVAGMSPGWGQGGWDVTCVGLGWLGCHQGGAGVARVSPGWGWSRSHVPPATGSALAQ